MNRLAKAKGLKPVNMNKASSEGLSGMAKLRSLRYPSVESWLKKIAQSRYVVTDSYHGTVFSIIFNKEFLVFGNEKRGNSRFDNLLGMLNLRNRMIIGSNTIDMVDMKPIDYVTVNRKKKEYQEISMEFLYSALTR